MKVEGASVKEGGGGARPYDSRINTLQHGEVQNSALEKLYDAIVYMFMQNYEWIF